MTISIQTLYPSRVVFLVISLTLLGTACSVEPEFPLPENQFCVVIEDGRESYTERAAINDPLDKQRQRKDVRMQRDRELRAILPKGTVQGWYGEIIFLPRYDSTPQLALKLPCGPAFLIVANVSQNPVLLRPILRIQEEQYVQAFGTLNLSLPGAVQELSATELDSMYRPLLSFNLIRLKEKVDHFD